MNHMEVNIQNIIILLWVEELKGMVYLSITNWFDHIVVWIWIIFRGRFKWKLLRLNLSITIINVTRINSPHNSWNHRPGFGGRGTGFELIFWRLDVTLSWWLSWFITMKGVALFHLYSTTWWEEVRDMDDSCIRLVYNSSTEFTNNILLNAESCNNWQGIFCINICGRRSTKMMRVLT